MTFLSEFEDLTSRELIERLSTRIYEPAFCKARDQIFAVPSSLRVVILVLDFDTEVNMQGMLGFLENSTGRYISETIESFHQIGAHATAKVLQNIHGILETHGISTSQLRSDFDRTTLYQVTSFNELHGDLGSLPKEVERESQRLYVYAESGCSEDVWSLLDSFVDANRPGILAELARVSDA
ncbi:hypothetical protein Plim_3934 [Planctopirus limnophila DSM 3776]|uniref:DNA mimic protein DMP19 C-terminal domain-containing protein n=1 Tax=Planctopirus limnophila (strain ATCC 43296 / DSM 3776 / IFAM 1008 / Mu 290) TaxID=521674 RepID=D5SXC3_PLAL2|nr:DUF4375 domain-containing protein [Planctopirus limnophila]ADG69745.1 hypothetical protein Plim_3934 [Planctopirus limnophila DSM 3776]